MLYACKPYQAHSFTFLNAGVKRLFMFSSVDDEVMSSICQAAAEYTKNVLQQLNLGLELIQFKEYTSSQADSLRFYANMVNEAIDLQADAILGCDYEVSMQVAELSYAIPQKPASAGVVKPNVWGWLFR